MLYIPILDFSQIIDFLQSFIVSWIICVLSQLCTSCKTAPGLCPRETMRYIPESAGVPGRLELVCKHNNRDLPFIVSSLISSVFLC